MRWLSLSPEVRQQVEEAIASLRYGTVQITVHNARVVQIDKVERVRLPLHADLSSGRDPSTSESRDRTSDDAPYASGA
jgi:hypothetical protein